MKFNSPHTLYVIGNGFDVHHNIDSRYTDYHKWLDNGKFLPDTDVELCFDGDCELWSSLEENIGQFDCEEFSSRIVSDNPPSVSSEHFENTLSDGSSEVESQLNEWHDVVAGKLRAWVESLRAPDARRRIVLCKEDSVFLSFNYTTTLEDLYGVHSSRVLHIHGVKGCAKLEFGHGGFRKEDVRPESFCHDEEDDCVTEDSNLSIAINLGRSMARGCVASWEKPVKAILERNQEFFASLRSVERVVFLGFGFSKVDKPYVMKIKESVRPDSRWFASWHTQQDVLNIIRDLGPDVKLLRMEDMLIEKPCPFETKLKELLLLAQGCDALKVMKRCRFGIEVEPESFQQTT